MADNKRSWLVYGATGELVTDVPLARWTPFADDTAAQASTVHEGYMWAAIADTQGGKPRLQWTEDGGWQGSTDAKAAAGQPVNLNKPAAVDNVTAWDKRAAGGATVEDTVG